MKPASRHATPMWVSDEGEPLPLSRLTLGLSDLDGGKREAFIQELVHRNPSLIPMNEIEPAYTPLISVCRELPTEAGYLDNLWITPTGALVLGECKLVKNPQARREVVAQGLDYARAIAAWSYQDLEEHVRKALDGPKGSLWELVKDASDLDEAEFVDAVERRLRASRMMVLIIGDGIQEGAESLSNFLQMHAGIHAGLALVDLSIWGGLDGGLLVVPRIPMRTELIERGVVSIDEAGRPRISAPTIQRQGATSGQAVSLSEMEFYDQLGQRRPEVVADLKAFVASLAEVGINPEFRRSLVLRWWPTPDRPASAGYIDLSGAVWLGDGYGSANRLGHPVAGERYLAEVAAAVGGTVKSSKGNDRRVYGSGGRIVTIGELLAHADEWKHAIADLVAATTAPADV